MLLTTMTRQQIIHRLSSSGGCAALARRHAATTGASTASRSVTYIAGFYPPTIDGTKEHNCIKSYNSCNKTYNSSHKLFNSFNKAFNNNYDKSSSRYSTRRLSSTAELKESYDHILVETRFPEDNSVVGGGVGVISLHRPKALNALCDALFEDLIHAVRAFDNDDDIGCIVITGSGEALGVGEVVLVMNVFNLYTLCIS